MLLIALFALASPASGGKISGVDDWNPVTIVSVGSPSPTSPATFILVQAGDLDGDGLPDDAYLKLSCADGALASASYQVKGPRDAGSGQSSGKRMTGPVTFVKDWGPPTAELGAMKPTYDVKALKGARRFADDDWSPITLANTDGLCETAGAAAKSVKAVKTRSNIQNN